jgi:hypothetical protein
MDFWSRKRSQILFMEETNECPSLSTLPFNKNRLVSWNYERAGRERKTTFPTLLCHEAYLCNQFLHVDMTGTILDHKDEGHIQGKVDAKGSPEDWVEQSFCANPGPPIFRFI